MVKKVHSMFIHSLVSNVNYNGFAGYSNTAFKIKCFRQQQTKLNLRKTTQKIIRILMIS